MSNKDISVRNKAFALWIKSDKKRGILTEIAEQLNVEPSHVRQWKYRDKWDDKVSVTDEKGNGGNVTKRKKPKKKHGGQPGNTNAVGHGAPKGNKNAVTHGIYEQIYWETLDDKELEMITAMKLNDEMALLQEQLQLIAVRERRLQLRIEKLRQEESGLAIENVTTKKNNEKGNLAQETEKEETTTLKVSTVTLMQKIETELTRIQRQKTQVIREIRETRAGQSVDHNGIGEWKDMIERVDDVAKSKHT